MRTIRSLQLTVRIQQQRPSSVLSTPYFAQQLPTDTDDDDKDESDASNEDVGTTTTTTTTSFQQQPTQFAPMTPTKSIFQIIEELAQQLKLMAIQANAKAALYTIDTTKMNTGSSSSSSINTNTVKTVVPILLKKYRYILQSCLCYTLFLLYRAYRGFFIILPAVYTETYRKIQQYNVIDEQPFDVVNETTGSSTSSKMNLRTRITISMISIFVIVTYVMGGAIRVSTSFIRSLYNGASIPQSLQTAIQTQEYNEESLLLKTTTTTTATSSTTSSSSSSNTIPTSSTQPIQSSPTTTTPKTSPLFSQRTTGNNNSNTNNNINGTSNDEKNRFSP